MQLIVSGLVCPQLKRCFDIEDAQSHGLIDDQIKVRLREISHAKCVILSLPSSDFPIITAYDQGSISETVTVKMINTLLSCGCLELATSREQVNVNKLFQKNMISTSLFTKLIERQKMAKDLIDPISAEKITLGDLFQRTVKDEKTGMRLLLVNSEDKGKITLKSGRKINVLRAAHEGILDREIMYRLLGAQLLSGGIIDLDTGNQLTLEQAQERGVIDRVTVCGILTQQVQNGGILCPSTRKYLTVDEAVQCNLISYSSALMVLEAQRGFIGLIWPNTSEIFPISTSLQQGMISTELAQKILSNRRKIAGLYIPETSEIVQLNIASQSGLIEENTASVLSSLELQDKMPNIDILEPTKHTLKWISTYESHTTQQTESSENKSEEELTHNPDHTKQLFISYLMINSYIDANTGERLLLFDGDLDEAASMLLESEHIVRTSCENDEGITDTLPEDLEVRKNYLSHDVDMNIIEYESKSHSNLVFKETEDMKAAAEQHQFMDKIDITDHEEVYFQLLKDVEATDISSEMTVQHNPIARTHGEAESFIRKDIEDDAHLCQLNSMVDAVDNKCNNLIQENNIHNYFNEGSTQAEEVYNHPEEVVSTSNIIIKDNTEDTVESFGDIFQDQLQNTPAEELCNKDTDHDSHAILPSQTSSDVLPYVKQDTSIDLYGYLENSSDSDMSDANFESEDEAGDTDETKKTWKTIGNGIIEYRTPTQSDTSSDEDTYYYTDIDAQNIDILQGRQFLETIIEEDSESYSCLDDQTSIFKEKSFSSSFVEEEHERSKYECAEKDVDGNMKTDDKFMSEELDEEYVESSFSETDIDCFVTDENNSEEGYQVTEGYLDEYFEDKEIDSKAVLLNFDCENNETSVHIEHIMCPKPCNSGNLSNLDDLSESDEPLQCQEQRDIISLGNSKTSLRESSSFIGEDSESNQTGTKYLYDKSSAEGLQSEIENKSETPELINHKDNRSSTLFDTEGTSVHNGLEFSDDYSTCKQETNSYGSPTNNTNPIPECILMGKENASAECNIANVQAEDKKICRQVANGHQSNDQTAAKIIEHSTTERSTVHSKNDSESNTLFDPNSEKMLENHSIKEVKAVFDADVTNSESNYHIEGVQSEGRTIQKVNSDVTEDNTLCKEKSPLLPKTNDSEICKITDMLNKKEESRNYGAKSPIHIDNLSAIFESSISKSDDLVGTATSTDFEIVQKSNVLDMQSSNAGEADNLTNYLKGCARIVQTIGRDVYAKQTNLGVTNTEEKLDILLPQLSYDKSNQSTKDSDEDPKPLLVLVNRVSRSMNVSKDKLIEVREPAHNLGEVNKHTKHITDLDLFSVKSKVEDGLLIKGDYKKQGKHIEKDSVIYDIGVTQNQETFSTSSSFSEQEVLEPNRPKLISSQIDEIFHVPPDSENSNKLEEIIININKGLFPSEPISSSIPDQMIKLIPGKKKQFSPDYSSESPGTARKFCFTDQTCNVKSLDVDTTKNVSPKYSTESPGTTQKFSFTDQTCNVKSLDVEANTESITHSSVSEVEENAENKESEKATLNQCCQTLSDHMTVVQDQKLHFDNFPTLGDNLETLKLQLDQLELFKSRLAAFSVTLKKDVQFAEQILTSVPGDLPGEHLNELIETLRHSFATVCEMSSCRAKQIACAVDAEMDKLAETHRDLLNRLQFLADWITSSNEKLNISTSSNDVDVVKQSIQSLKALSSDVSVQKIELETTAFDAQFFISEHAQDLSPNQSKQLLRSLNATQKRFQDSQKWISSHMEALECGLLAAQDLNEQKV
ncbi:uncharacterized protein [Dendrobates tinctorius]|uniref:uncharacterized protein n=1 Tax=Dendrobates tinctorius TaxID=92724 RepID=UPI003CCA3EDC